MSSQQRAALTNAALINFFGTSGTVSTIMQTVQQTQQQTEQYTLGTNFISTEQSQQLLPVVATDSEENSGTSNSLDITNQDNSQDTTQQKYYTTYITNITHTDTHIYTYIYIKHHKLNTNYNSVRVYQTQLQSSIILCKFSFLRQ